MKSSVEKNWFCTKKRIGKRKPLLHYDCNYYVLIENAFGSSTDRLLAQGGLLVQLWGDGSGGGDDDDLSLSSSRKQFQEALVLCIRFPFDLWEASLVEWAHLSSRWMVFHSQSFATVCGVLGDLTSKLQRNGWAVFAVVWIFHHYWPCFF